MSSHGNPTRIISGLRDDGSSFLARVEAVEADFRSSPTGSTRVYRMWASDRLPFTLPVDGLAAPIDSEPTAEQTPDALRTSPPHPGPSGMRVSLVEFRPPGEAPTAPRMRWFDTVDIGWLISGELTVVMDDGSEAVMRPGDVVIHHGTSHDWRIGAEGAVMGLVMLGATRDGAAPPSEHKAPTPRA